MKLPKNVLRQRIIEILRNHDLAPAPAGNALGLGSFTRDQAGHLLASLGNDDLLAASHGQQQTAKMGFGFVNIDNNGFRSSLWIDSLV